MGVNPQFIITKLIASSGVFEKQQTSQYLMEGLDI